LPLISLAASSALVWAGRVFDCKDDYDFTVASCKMPYGDPEDMDDLRLCLQAAKDDYESCNEDCMD